MMSLHYTPFERTLAAEIGIGVKSDNYLKFPLKKYQSYWFLAKYIATVEIHNCCLTFLKMLTKLKMIYH